MHFFKTRSKCLYYFLCWSTHDLYLITDCDNLLFWQVLAWWICFRWCRRPVRKTTVSSNQSIKTCTLSVSCPVIMAFTTYTSSSTGFTFQDHRTAWKLEKETPTLRPCTPRAVVWETSRQVLNNKYLSIITYAGPNTISESLYTWNITKSV